MKNYAKAIGFIFLLLLSFSLLSHAQAEDSFSPGSDWQEIPAYGPELTILADWQEVSSGNTADDDAVETFYNAPSGGTDSMQPNETSPITGSGSSDIDNMFSGLMGNSSGMGGLGNMLGGLMGNSSGMGGLGNMLGGFTGGGGNPFGGNAGGLGNIIDSTNRWEFDLMVGTGYYENEKDYSHADQPIPMTLKPDSGLGLAGDDVGQVAFSEKDGIDANTVIVGSTGKEVYRTHKDSLLYDAICNSGFLVLSNNAGGLNGPGLQFTNGNQTVISSLTITADFDPCKPGLETKFFSPLVLDTDHSGAIALDGGVIQFDIAPHLAGLETIPVPAAGKDMFLVWDKAGTETIEGAAREYKEGEIVDITELFGPEDYSCSDFSKLAYSDDGFTKLAKLCDVNKDGRVDKQDTALSAEVAAKLKLWSPLSGELILFKDTDIVIDVRVGSYERHPSDVEGWAVEYKMKDGQDNLAGYQWLTSKTSSLLCVDVLLAVQ